MIVAHRTLQPDSGINQIAAVRGAFNGKTALLVAQSSTLHVMDPKTLQILDSYPFRNSISILAVYPGPEQYVFILLSNLNYFIFNLPELKSSGTISLNGSIFASRRILPITNPIERGSLGSNFQITQSIRFKEKQFAFASHPQFVALSIASGFIHFIPKDRPQFYVPINYNNIVDMCFLGPTMYTGIHRLALLTDSSTNNRELHVFKISGRDIEEEFSITLPPDAYSIIPLKQESEASLVISTSNGVHRITAPIDVPFTQEPLSTFVSTIAISHTSLGNDLYLILDAEGGICAAQFPIEGRPKVEKLSKTNSLGGSIIAIDNNLIVSSPYFGMVSYNYELTHQGCNIIEQARYSVSGPIRHMAYDGKQLYVANEKIRLYEKTISCRNSCIMNVKGVYNIFSANNFLCASLSNSSILFDVHDSNLVQTKDLSNFIYDHPTIYFGMCLADSCQIQITDKCINIIGKDPIMFDQEITCASCNGNDLCVVCTDNTIKFYSLSSLNQASDYFAKNQCYLVACNSNFTAVLLIDLTLLIFNSHTFELINELNAVDFNCYTSMVVLEPREGQYEILLGTIDGHLIHFISDSSNNTPIIESLSNNRIMLHQLNQTTALSAGDPPIVTGKERIFIGSIPCIDIVQCNDNFVILSVENDQLMLLNSETPGGSSRTVLPIDNVQNFAILDQNPTNVLITKEEHILENIPMPEQNNEATKQTTNEESCVSNQESREGELETTTDDESNPSQTHKIIFCQQGDFTVKSYVNQKEINSFTSLHKIVLMKGINYQGRNLLLLGTDDQYSIILLDTNLTVICTQTIEALPTAVCVVDPYLIVANRTLIDFFIGKQSESTYELDKVHYEKTYSLTTDLSNYRQFLIVSDSNQAIAVYFVNFNYIYELDRDCNQRGISAIGMIGNYLFAADYSNTILIYMIDESGIHTNIIHIGEFLADSRVLSFEKIGNKLVYGTEGGCIGSFVIATPEYQDLVSISLTMDNEGFFFIKNRLPPSKFEWPAQNSIIDIDNLLIGLEDKELLEKCQFTKEHIKSLIESLNTNY